MESTAELYDLLILVDATNSMHSYLNSLQISLPQIIQISTLTNCFSRIGILAYRDYCERGRNLMDWSGWMSLSDEEKKPVNIVAIAKRFLPDGGGDGPEATKTGLARAYELMRKEATTIILLYTDAPPHTPMNGIDGDPKSNLGPEQKALKIKTSYGGYGPKFADLVSASQWISGRKGEKKAQIFCILEPSMYCNEANYYIYLATMTGGACFFLLNSKPITISKVTLEVLLSWMGAEKAEYSINRDIPARMARYISIKGIKSLKTECDPAANKFFYATPAGEVSWKTTATNVTKVVASSELLKKHLPKKVTPVQDFAKRYTTDPHYKKLALPILKKIIEDDVVAISINPVFGSLWRAVCNDKTNEEREEILVTFGLKVESIKGVEEKARMKAWLEESYDFTAEVLEAIESVAEADRFPCVFLDPTAIFTPTEDIEKDDEDNTKPITAFRRDELLEIGRSCNNKILRRLGRVLTQLTYVNTTADLPAHIAATPEKDIPRIPMALAKSKYKRKFWRLLLHTVVPGTMLSARPAALLAALSIRLGIEPLLEAANHEMTVWRGRWNNLENPETWNVSCLGLLMDADDAYQQRLKETTSEEDALLNAEDRALFQRLVSYKMLELNLNTSLTAQVPWTPQKTKVAIGPTAVCVACTFPRSITVMGPRGKCGLCIWDEKNPPSDDQSQSDIAAHVSMEDDENTLATWVECNIRTCRVQYTVYMAEALNVKPKCHYCREKEKAPFVKCSTCVNRIIYPKEYRASDMKDFKCYACVAGRKTTIDCETTAKGLCIENDKSWLLRNDNKKISEPLKGRTLFHTISTAGTASFCSKVELFPHSTDLKLVLRGKPVRNVPTLVKELESWILRRRIEQGDCSLCFSSFRKDDLHSVCGRSACSQRVCAGCLGSWYGLNSAGRIINIKALFCPFCCRSPISKTLAKYGTGIHAVANLKNAVARYGQWIYAWCIGCGHAKKYLERVCAAGSPAELVGWNCVRCCERAELKIMEFKECPGCNAMTEKNGGCDHMACRCGCHWCWHCGKKCDWNTIYRHMSEEHGGFFNVW